MQAMILAFYAFIGLQPQPINVQLVETFPVISTPYGERQAHGWAKPPHTILLREGHWATLNRWQQQELLWHELAHLQGCYYHSEETNDIMNPHAPEVYWVRPDGANWSILAGKLRRFLEECEKPKGFFQNAE